MRTYNDSHPAPYKIDTFELGNEQENPNFLAQVQAIEARRAAIPGAPEWYFMYPENAGPSAAVAASLVAAGVEGRRIMADCHVGASGGIGCSEQTLIWQSFNGSGINCETNAVTSNLIRGAEEAADLLQWFNQPADVTARLRARTASFCIQRSGQMRDMWDQGLSFFLPNMTWLQPPGAVHALMAATWQPNALRTAVTGGGSWFSGAAQQSDDGKTLVVQLVNGAWGHTPGAVDITVTGFTPRPAVDFWLLAEPGAGDVNTTAGNTPAAPGYISAVKSALTWPATGALHIDLPPLGFAVLVLTSA